MLNSQASRPAHAAQNAALIILTIALLPISLPILVGSLAVSLHNRPVRPPPPPGSRKTVLVTGVGMTKGLALARAFHAAGHRVIGADFSAAAPGRFSRAVERFVRLPKPSTGAGAGAAPYIEGLVAVIQEEKVDLWVSCSGVASAVEDGEAKEVVERTTPCRAVQFDVAATQMLHEKHTFIARTARLGLPVPETHTVTSRDAVEDALRRAPSGRKYILKTIGVDDAARGDIATLLPRDTPQETSRHLARLRISEAEPWILQQFVVGDEFCTHALVVRGHVRAFVACPSSELLMHYTALPPESALSRAMLAFTQTYAAEGGESFSGHLSFDFLVEDPTPTEPDEIVLYPIECNPRAHTAVCLFNGTPEMVDGYLDLLADGLGESEVVTPRFRHRYYWVGHDLVELVLSPLLEVVRLRASPVELARRWSVFLTHLMTWKDGTFELWDPAPWFCLYHVYWPMQFLACLWSGRKWSRLNVSTLKVFEC
jgi:hypothetical protein